MKKSSSIVLAIALIITTLFSINITSYAGGVISDGIIQSGDYKYVINDGNATICGYVGNDNNVVIPSQIDGYTVTTISMRGMSNTSIVNLEIPNTITTIAPAAFCNNSKLEEVTFNDSVTKFGDSVFDGCSNLRVVRFGKNCDLSAPAFFYNCPNVTDVYVYNSVTSFYDENDVFDSIPHSTVTIHGYANTSAETYANKYGNPFVAIESCTGQHTYDSGIVYVKPTCYSTGLTKYNCTNCGFGMTTELETVDHNIVDSYSCEPTCHSDGEGGGKHCSFCGLEITPSQAIPFDRNNLVLQYSNPATCQNLGENVYKCRVCSETIIEYTDKVGHNFDNNSMYCNICHIVANPNYISVQPMAQPDTNENNNTTSSPTVNTNNIQAKPSNPSKTSISKITSKKKGFSVSWKKQNVDGYQIQYSTDKGFKKDIKNITVSKKSTTFKTVSKLKAKKKYYVRIRTYKTVNGKKVYSSWSSVKSVTTKK